MDQSEAAAAQASKTAAAESRSKLAAAKRGQSEAESDAKREKAARMRTESNAAQLISEQAAMLQRTEKQLVNAESSLVSEMDRRIDTEVENTALQTQMRHMQTARDRVIQENARLEADIDERKAKQRALSRNASRTRKRAEKRHQDEVDKAKLAASMIIKVRHGDGPRAHATTRAWIA